VAEEEKFGMDAVTAGAASDIQQATRLARAMVTRWGLSEAVGPVDYADDQGQVFLGQQLVQNSSVSEETSKRIEEEVRKLIQQGMDDARAIMVEHRDQWTLIAEGLLEYETLTGDEIRAMMDGKMPDRPDEPDEPSGGSAVPVIGKRRKDSGGEGFSGGEPEPA
jgi:cell division protease FtsH